MFNLDKMATTADDFIFSTTNVNYSSRCCAKQQKKDNDESKIVSYKNKVNEILLKYQVSIVRIYFSLLFASKPSLISNNFWYKCFVRISEDINRPLSTVDGRMNLDKVVAFRIFEELNRISKSSNSYVVISEDEIIQMFNEADKIISIRGVENCKHKLHKLNDETVSMCCRLKNEELLNNLKIKISNPVYDASNITKGLKKILNDDLRLFGVSNSNYSFTRNNNFISTPYEEVIGLVVKTLNSKFREPNTTYYQILNTALLLIQAWVYRCFYKIDKTQTPNVYEEKINNENFEYESSLINCIMNAKNMTVKQGLYFLNKSKLRYASAKNSYSVPGFEEAYTKLMILEYEGNDDEEKEVDNTPLRQTNKFSDREIPAHMNDGVSDDDDFDEYIPNIQSSRRKNIACFITFFIVYLIMFYIFNIF